MSELLQLAIYNPSILKDEDFLAGFVARRELVGDLLAPLHAITRRSLAKHRLILGKRGMGKTSLLRRIALGVREDPELSQVLIPLTFREEQYNVHNLHTFWCNCLDALGDYFERSGQHEKAQALDQEVANLTRPSADRQNPGEEGEAALAALKGWAKRESKRLLLLLDNIDLILDALEQDHWTLRRTLQEPGGIVVIGAASAYLEATADPKGAFYDFFQVTVLERLSQNELLSCLRRLATVRGSDGERALQIINSDPARIRTLYDLTGGNPRTLVLLYLLLERDAVGDVMSDLERLLDQVTVLYKSRVEDLAPQARVVLDAVALAWNPVTAADLSNATAMETSAVSSQLDRLLKSGVIEKVNVSTSNRAAFQVGERFFNIWYLMRHGPRRQRSRLRWLTGFLRGFYSPQQLIQKATSLLKQQISAVHAHGNLFLALSEAVEDGGLRNLLRQEALKEYEIQAAQNGQRIDDLVDPDELPPPQTAKEWYEIGQWRHLKLEHYSEAEAAYRRAIDIDANHADSWFNLARVLTDHLKRHAEAEAAYRRTIQIQPNASRGMDGLGQLLTAHLGRPGEALTLLRNALQTNPDEADLWFRLGLAEEGLNHSDEAVNAYRRASEIDPRTYSYIVGIVLAIHNQDKEAEVLLHRGTELDPESPFPWLSLGMMLSDFWGRYDEGAIALSRATAIDPTFALPWQMLGSVKLYFLEESDQAEAAFKEAVRLDPDDLLASSGLLAIQLTASGNMAIVESDFANMISRQPADGAALLRAIRSLANSNFGDACNALKDALAVEQKNIFGNYEGLYLLVFRFAARQGFGDRLLAWMDEQSLTDRYWPLRAAYDAYLHGEKRLMDVNPEVRGAAKRIYDRLDSPRRYREKSGLGIAPQEKLQKRAKRNSSRRIQKKLSSALAQPKVDVP